MLRKTSRHGAPAGIPLHASMRPQRNAAENTGAVTEQLLRAPSASMRPQRNAAENDFGTGSRR